MDQFVAWNLCLLRAFFSAAFAREETWLAVDPAELDALGPNLGGDAGFLNAVRCGPPWATIRSNVPPQLYLTRSSERELVQRAQALRVQRMQPELRPTGYVDPGTIAPEYADTAAPTYLPILAALVRACAGRPEGGYYAYLTQTLGLDSAWGSVEMSQVEELWRDLAAWCRATNHAFGRFEYRQLGGYSRIGIPRSQSVVSLRDVQMLPRVFAQAGVRPGQAVSSMLLADMKNIAGIAPYLSKPFRDALNRPEFSEPVDDQLCALLDDWDGRVPEILGKTTVDRYEAASVDEIGVALSLAESNALPWTVRWRVPSVRDSGTMNLTYGGCTWQADLTGDDIVTSLIPSVGAAEELRVAANEVLDRSATSDVVLEVRMSDQLTAEGVNSGRDIVLRHKPLRTLIGSFDEGGPAGASVTLVEHDLPAFGPAYLLACPGNVGNLRRYLARNEIDSDDCPVDGLPERWLLVCVRDCASIGDSERTDLPDGLVVRSQPRVLRLIGGCQIRRVGLRQFLRYDLPLIELDAPAETKICADGLTLREQLGRGGQSIQEVETANPPLARVSSIRRFEIIAITQSLSAVMIQALIPGGLRGTIRLRLAPEDGMASAMEGVFSLDNRGDPIVGTSGVRGIMLGGSSYHEEWPRLSAPQVSLGAIARREQLNKIVECPSADLLDALAQDGWLAYGRARDLMRRLLVRSRLQDTIDVHEVFRELRARGLLEIEVDSKGRWMRVHCAAPALYVISAMSPHGGIIGCVGGTLRLQHWRQLFESAAGMNVVLRADASSDALLPVIRVEASSFAELQQLAERVQLECLDQPSRSIARWAAHLEEVQLNVERYGVESLGSSASSAERFNPGSGTFTKPRALVLDATLSHQLFRFDDLETGRHKLYSLAYRDGEQRERFAFVRDARWGIWAALAAFGEFVRDHHGISDASPWPFEYSRSEATLWLPVRISLPVILERALVLCSGERPMQRIVSRAPDSHALVIPGIGALSRVYDHFVPSAPQTSRWHGYKWVPEEVAVAVAERLSGRVCYIAE
jgi:hypothetical protein